MIMNNILIVKPGAIGDLLQLTPVLRAIKTAYPHAAISLLVGSHATASLFKYNPHLSETIVYEKKGAHKSLSKFFKLWRYLRQNRYDLVLNYQRSSLKGWVLTTAALPCRILVYHKARDRIVHAVVNYLETVASLGVFTADHGLELITGHEDDAFAEKLFSNAEYAYNPVIAINPSASHPVNRWGTAQFAALADALAERRSAKIIIIGGTEDVGLAEEIMANVRSTPLSIAGKTTLLQLGSVLKRCDALVTGDTGPMHLATAVGTRVVALFGAADPQRTGPLGEGHTVIQAKGVPCVPCQSRTCRNRTYLACMEKIAVENVFDTVAGTLGKQSTIEPVE